MRRFRGETPASSGLGLMLLRQIAFMGEIIQPLPLAC